MAMTEITLSVCVDASGDYAVGKSDDEARDAYESNIGVLGEAAGFRIFRVTLTVPLPEPVELSGTVEESQTQPTLSVK